MTVGLPEALPDGVVCRMDERLARHSAWRTGGVCPAFVVVHEVRALGPTLDALGAAGLKWTLMGAGTRHVLRDGAVKRAILRLGTGFSGIIERGEGLEIGGSTPCPAVAWWMARRGYAGFEALARVPGSIGAAVSLDGGPWRTGLAEVGVWRRGAVRWVSADKAEGHKLIVGVRPRLQPANAEGVQAQTLASLAGSRALPSWYAAVDGGSAEQELIRVDAAGVRLRGVVIPAAAPEMVVNVGRGPARDLKLLHRSALKRVKQLRGVELTSAVRWVGRAS